MSLRIAWACHSTNVGLGIAAQVFVYVGTIILYIVNWFFIQRVIRAQHPLFGWSMPYRILHRLAIVCLILSLILLVVGAIQQFFTLNTTTLDIDRYLQLAGNTYFAAFCFAPIPMVILSLIFPRRRVEKFGAGRLRNNVVILLIAVAILSVGQIFRCVTAWLPNYPLRIHQGQEIDAPWYYSRWCFYVFNFATEILVVIFYAVTRVDLRFYVPDGSKKVGDYSNRPGGRYHVDIIGNEKNLKRTSTGPFGIGVLHPNGSSETLHEYESSLFDDTRTLADSLRYPSSILEVDPKSGHWKIKRASGAGSVTSLQRHSNTSEGSVWDPTRNTYVNENTPPVPDIPTDWPLRESQLPRGSIPVMEHQNRGSRSAGQSSLRNEIGNHDMNAVDMGNSIEDAIRKLEANSEVNKAHPPDYDAITPVKERSGNVTPLKSRQSSAEVPRKHVYQPSPLRSEAADIPRKHVYSPVSNNPWASELPQKHSHSAVASSSASNLPRKIDYSGTASGSSSDLPKKRDYSAHAPLTSHPPTPPNKHYSAPSPTSAGSDIPKKHNYARPDELHFSALQQQRSPPPQPVSPPQSSHRSGATSFETATAEREFKRFSFEAPPRRGEDGFEGGSSESEREWERRYRG